MITVEMANGSFDFLDASLAMQVELVNDGSGCVVFLSCSLIGFLLGFILWLLFFLQYHKRHKLKRNVLVSESLRQKGNTRNLEYATEYGILRLSKGNIMELKLTSPICVVG